MSDLIEYPNDMGPLFANTYEYYARYMPPIHNWAWTDNIQASVAYMSYAALREHQTKLKLGIIYLSDAAPSFNHIIEICRMYNPSTLIVTSMPDVQFKAGRDNMLNVNLRTIVSRANVNFMFLANVFPDLRRIYAYALTTVQSPGPAEFPKLQVLSAVHMQSSNILNMIVAPKLQSLDMYSVQDGDGTAPVNIPSSVAILRIDARVKIADNLTKNEFKLLQYYGACNNLNVDRINEMKPFDLILAENSLTVKQIKELYKDMRSLGVYVNDKNLNDYIEKFKKVLTIYGAVNKHQKVTIRRSHMYCNFNIFSRMNVWENVFKAQQWEYIQISKEIVKTNDLENVWPSYPSFNRSRMIRWRDNTLFINSTCNNIETLYALVEKIKEHIEFNALEIHIRGACLNENTLRMALAHIYTGKIKFQQSPDFLY